MSIELLHQLIVELRRQRKMMMLVCGSCTDISAYCPPLEHQTCNRCGIYADVSTIDKTIVQAQQAIAEGGL
jgi:hypothetical protein